MPYLMNSTKSRERGLAVRRNSHSKRVEDQILLLDTVFSGISYDPPGYRDPFLCAVRYAVLVKRQGHHEAAVFCHQGEYRLHHFLFAVHRIYHGLSVIGAKPGFHRGDVSRIELERKV